MMALALDPPTRFAPATTPGPIGRTRMLVIDVARERLHDSLAANLPEFLSPGDVCVVNDAATLPASLHGHVRDLAIEVRLLALPNREGITSALVFGRGDWHTPTEHRAPPPALHAHDDVQFANLSASVVRVTGRIATLQFDGAPEDVVRAIYLAGKPVQYAHIAKPLALWDVQNVYAGEPWAVEMPSAGRPLDFALLTALRARGIEVVSLTHGAGLSSTGDAALDASLPWVERYRIPEATARAVNAAKRVVAIGTSAVRALESSAAMFGEVRGIAEAETTLRIDGAHPLRVASGLLTGMHDGTTSHADLMASFAPPHRLDQVWKHAADAGYRGHEFGDTCLILRA